MVRRKKTTIFLDAKESTTVLELKKMIEGITKKGPSEQQLYNKDDAGAGYFYIRAEGGGGAGILFPHIIIQSNKSHLNFGSLWTGNCFLKTGLF